MTNAELRRLAEASQAQDPEWWGPRLQSLLMGEVPDRTAELDAELIRACSPDVIIALLDRCEALEKERDAARNLMPWRSDVVAFAELADRAPRCDAAEDLASWCMMILRAHAAKGGE